MIMEPGIDGLKTYRRIPDFNPEQKAINNSWYLMFNLLRDNAVFQGYFFKHDNDAGGNPMYNIYIGVPVGG